MAFRPVGNYLDQEDEGNVTLGNYLDHEDEDTMTRQ